VGERFSVKLLVLLVSCAGASSCLPCPKHTRGFWNGSQRISIWVGFPKPKSYQRPQQCWPSNWRSPWLKRKKLAGNYTVRCSRPCERIPTLRSFAASRHDLRSRDQWPRIGQREKLRRAGIADLFSFVVCSAELGVRKPQREFFNEVVRQAGIAPAQILTIGNNPYD